MFKPEDAEVRSGAPNGGIDLLNFGGRELIAEPLERLGTPALLGRDAAAQVSDTHGLAGFKASKGVRETIAFVAFDQRLGQNPAKAAQGDCGKYGEPVQA